MVGPTYFVEGGGILVERESCIAFINLIKKDSTYDWQKRDSGLP